MERMFDQLVDVVDPTDAESLAALPTERLEAEMMSLAGHLAAATCSFLLMVAEFDRRGGAADWECLSTAHWLNWRCGVGMCAAREQVRVARRLEELPVVRAEFSAGRLSYSKVRAITRVAHRDIEVGLVRMAQSATAAHMDRACRALRRTQDLEAAEAELREGERSARERQQLSWYRTDEGDLVLRARVGAEDAETVLAAIRAATGDPDPGALVGDGLDRRRADALVDIAAAYLANPDPDTSSGVSASPEIVVHFDAAAVARLAGDQEQLTAWPVTTASGFPLSFAAFERLLGDSGRRAVLRLPDGSELNLGRHQRTVTPVLRRALLARDHHCRFPGCDRTSRLKAHHIVWWSRGGRTDMENLLMLCSKHHRDVHEGGWTLTGTASEHTFTDPDGRIVDPTPPVLDGSLAELRQLHATHGRDIAIDGAGGRWLGDHIDWDCFFAAFAN
jgi:hypothetical protein